MRILLIYRIDTSEKSHSGALIKMESQKRALISLGHEVTLINHDKKHILVDNKPIKYLPIKSKLKRYYFNYKLFWNALRKEIEFKDFDLLYIRYPFSSKSFVSFCKTAKSVHTNLKILIEMPTYPYRLEFSGWKKIYLILDKYYRDKLYKSVDKVVHFGEESVLFGIPTIQTTNGIEPSFFKIKEPKVDNQIINLIGVGKWSYWHGLDRVINGMANYYEDVKAGYDIYFYIIGEGDELSNLKQLVSKYKQLKNRIIFTGIKTGKDLDEYFDKADIGIGSLGMHRKGINYNASLKHREYCARGLKFVLSTNDRAFPKSIGFIKYIPIDETPVKMRDFIDLYNIEISPNRIREYALSELSWESIMVKVISSLH